MEINQYINYYTQYKDLYLYTSLTLMIITGFLYFMFESTKMRLTLVSCLVILGFVCIGISNLDPTQINHRAVEAIPR